MLLHVKFKAKSSAYKIDVNILETLGRSFIANRNNKLPRTEPCGTDIRPVWTIRFPPDLGRDNAHACTSVHARGINSCDLGALMIMSRALILRVVRR